MTRVRLFLAGDVMTGRGIDQILARPCDPVLYEQWVRDARVYVELAERVNGPIPRCVSDDYVWGDLLNVLSRLQPDVSVVNLETSVTSNDEPWPGKGINYRMHPDNVGFLMAARLDCCVLANNHVLDWGHAGLEETLGVLKRAGLATTGAGRTAAEALAPARLRLPGGGRVLVFAFGEGSSGIPPDWRADVASPGINLLEDLSVATARRVCALIEEHRRAGDVVVLSVHWGGNWGYAIPAEQRAFAHALIELGAVNIVHGHSSHHARGIEVYRGVPVIYGCGDFLNDYEGIAGHERYRPDLALGYFVDVDATGRGLEALAIAPFRIAKFRLEMAGEPARTWISDTLTREGKLFGTSVAPSKGPELALHF
jgi:poly-gamma-glutamate capsule biosynthesis protein CapA/YwtB (metallophosphatase superfamily)